MQEIQFLQGLTYIRFFVLTHWNEGLGNHFGTTLVTYILELPNIL